MSDVSNIVQAFSTGCSNGGTVVFPKGQNYYVASKSNPIVRDRTIEWHSVRTISPDITYWRQPQNHYPIAFHQHHEASFILTGDGDYIDFYGTEGIFGNGDVWYTAEAGDTQPGRPVPFVFWNVFEVAVSDFFVH